MARTAPSVRQEQRAFADELRRRGCTRVDVATAFHRRYGVNMRVAARLAHGWSQREAASRWTDRWPAEPKTDKSISYWEQWPSGSGHRPSLDVLARLAELYSCGVADLLADAPAYHDRDPAHRARTDLARLTSGPSPPANLADLVRRLDEMDVEDLAGVVSRWAEGSATVDRRLLLKVSAGFTLAAAAPGLEPDEPSPPEPPRPALDLGGIWHSRYAFTSTGRGALTAEHRVALRQRGSQLTGSSGPHEVLLRQRDCRPVTEYSHLRLALSIYGSVVTGTWSEETSPDGYYKGARYHGAVQLIVNPTGRAMEGRWLGFGKDFAVENGEWSLTRT